MERKFSKKYLVALIKNILEPLEMNNSSISFINYGDMIEQENLKRLFDRLYSVEKKFNKKEGTRLGLAI